MLQNNTKFEITEKVENLKLMARDRFQLNLTPDQLDQFASYTNLLLDWNERVNLTAITNIGEIMIKHFLDSLVFVQWLNNYYASTKIKFADLGTGAGFPGIPIKIMMPEAYVVLIDSLAKRLTFLEEVIGQLNLTNIRTYHARAEDIGQNPLYRETFDIVTARAVAELPVLLEYTIPLLKVGGRLFAAKGVEPENEVGMAKNALKILKCELEHMEKYWLAEGADNRSLLIIKKVDITSSKYPRQSGKPKKNPL